MFRIPLPLHCFQPKVNNIAKTVDPAIYQQYGQACYRDPTQIPHSALQQQAGTVDVFFHYVFEFMRTVEGTTLGTRSAVYDIYEEVCGFYITVLLVALH